MSEQNVEPALIQLTFQRSLPESSLHGIFQARVLECVAISFSRASPTPQFKSINSSVLSFLHSPTLTSIHDHRKNHIINGLFNETAGSSCFLPVWPRSGPQIHCSFCWATLWTPAHTHNAHTHRTPRGTLSQGPNLDKGFSDTISVE